MFASQAVLAQGLDELKASAALEAAAIASLESAVCERLTAMEAAITHAVSSSDKVHHQSSLPTLFLLNLSPLIHHNQYLIPL